MSQLTSTTLLGTTTKFSVTHVHITAQTLVAVVTGPVEGKACCIHELLNWFLVSSGLALNSDSTPCVHVEMHASAFIATRLPALPGKTLALLPESSTTLWQGASLDLWYHWKSIKVYTVM